MATTHFNSYKQGLDLQFLKELCLSRGTVRQMQKGDFLEDIGQPSRWIGFITKGCLKYIVHNDAEGKDYITGFAFEGELVGDYPNCLYMMKSEVRIEANVPCELYVIEGTELNKIYCDPELEALFMGKNIGEALFRQTYERFLDLYRFDAKGRYERLLHRCPQILQMLSLKDIASFLKITPQMLSKIRKEITFGSTK